MHRLLIATLQVEILVRKVFCISKALAILPLNLEDAARSDVDFENAEKVCEVDLTSCLV
jgi:hypothetical protein